MSNRLSRYIYRILGRLQIFVLLFLSYSCRAFFEFADLFAACFFINSLKNAHKLWWLFSTTSWNLLCHRSTTLFVRDVSSITESRFGAWLCFMYNQSFPISGGYRSRRRFSFISTVPISSRLAWMFTIRITVNM